MWTVAIKSEVNYRFSVACPLAMNAKHVAGELMPYVLD